MGSILVINAAGRETRVALVENGHIAEFYLERKKDKGVVGNIYKGRVTRVLPGMQAAFVDIGLEKAAFLYVSDVFYDPEFSGSQFELTEGEHEEASEVPEESAEDVAVEHDHHAEAHGAPEHETIEGTATHVDAAPAAVDAHAGDSTSATTETPGETTAPTGAEVVAAAISEATPTPTFTEPVAAAATSDADASAQPAGETQVAAAGDAIPAASPSAPSAPPSAPRAPPTGSEVIAAAIAGAHAGRGEVRAPREQRAKEHRHAKPVHKRERKANRIEDLLKVGQEVLVQISKDPIGTKGARSTSHISIPGRHLVFMPTVDHVGISRRIGNEKERRRLREIVDRLRPPGTGFIVRTVAENVPQEKLEADIRFLIEVWNETLRKNEKRHGPGLMHPDLDLILRATRDLFAQDVEKLVIDDREEFERVQNFVAVQDTALKERVILHDSEEPIFDAYGIEEEIKRALHRKVWLKSGGYLIIDQAEALTAIDVNSGRYVGKKSLEETITKINTEAAREIVYQLRLRNIGGIIICDFIDMEKSQNRDKVFKSLQEALGRDKAKTNVLRISELGLVEMTRKRVRESIGRMMHEDCAYCDGTGLVKTTTTVAYEIFRELRRSAGAYRDPTLVINCNHEVANLIQGEERQELRHLMDRFNKSIQVRPQNNFHREQYDIFARPVQGNEYKVSTSPEAFTPTEYGAPKGRTANESKAFEGRGDRGGGGGGDRGGGDRAPGGGGGGGGNGGGAGGGGGRGRDRNRGRDRKNGGGGGGRDGKAGGENREARPSAPGNASDTQSAPAATPPTPEDASQ